MRMPKGMSKCLPSCYCYAAAIDLDPSIADQQRKASLLARNPQQARVF